MLPPQEPSLSRDAENAKGTAKARVDTKSSYTSGNRPAWAGDMKTVMFNEAIRHGMAFKSKQSGAELAMCFLCGAFDRINALTIEHCTPFAKILEKLATNAASDDGRRRYGDAARELFVSADGAWFPTEWAAYAYSHDLDNLLFAHSGCNSSKGDTWDPIAAIHGCNYSPLGSTYRDHINLLLRNNDLSHLVATQGKGRDFAWEPADGKGWAATFQAMLGGTRLVQVLLDMAEKTERSKVELANEARRALLGKRHWTKGKDLMRS
jgi:hypothetical protein